MDYKLEYLGNLRTIATHVRSGSSIQTDAPVDNNGKGEAFSPTDLVAAALVSCMITVVGIKAEQMGIEKIEMQAGVDKHMLSDPRRVGRIAGKLRIKINDAQDSAKTREILERTALTCPVAQSLDPALKQDISIEFD